MQSFNSLCSNHITLPEEEEGWCANCGAWTTGGTWAPSLGDLSFFFVFYCQNSGGIKFKYQLYFVPCVFVWCSTVIVELSCTHRVVGLIPDVVDGKHCSVKYCERSKQQLRL